MSDWPAPDPGIAEAARLQANLGAVIRAAWDAGLTVLPILPPDGDVEIRLVSDRDPLGHRFVGSLDEAVEDAFAFLCRQEAA